MCAKIFVILSKIYQNHKVQMENSFNEADDMDIKRESISILESLSSDYSMIEGFCYYSHITSDTSHKATNLQNTLFKVRGNVLVILVSGHMNVELNTEVINIDGPAVLSLSHGSLVSLCPTSDRELDAYILLYSPGFLRDINISFSSISVDTIVAHSSPVLELREREVHMLLRYVSIIHQVMSDTFNTQLNRHIVSSLTSALFYQVMLFFYRRIDFDDVHSGPRRNSYVQDFLKLVHVHYTTERSISFYASKLFISPKYLSLLVKEATGRSAACWIDHFVIMEAKNLLRYSGKNVQQVAYALNFSNQSSFGKYFKHLTGLSPTEFQKQS